MKKAHWEKAKDIFEQAMAVAPSARVQFLDKACSDDKVVRQEVEELLSSLENAENFMENPAVNQVAKVIIGENEKLESGRKLLHYEIIKPIGAGGMGEVYLAKDTKLARQVAVKILPANSNSSAEANERLLREARAAAKLDHPNICTIHEIAESDGRSFIVMQFVEGEDLAQTIKHESLDFGQSLRVAIQIAEALGEAHANHIIHRDIKPANIIVTPKGQVKVLDFGLAKSVAQDSEAETTKLLSVSGAIMGTVPYMSPEQVKGAKLDARTDIFSFGAMFYEMLSGEQPFRRENNAETISAILNFEPPTADFPANLQQILQKCLAKDKTERYQKVDNLLDDLRPLQKQLENEDEISPSVNRETASNVKTALLPNTNEQIEKTHILQPQTQEVEKPKRKRTWQITAFAFGVIALVATSLWFFFGRQNSFTAIGVQKAAQLTIWSGLDDFPSISPDGNSVAYCSNHTGSFEIYIKSPTSGAKEIQLTNDGKQNFEPAWSPDGQRIAYYSKGRGGIWIIPASGGEVKQLTDFGSHPAWSPDGKQIVFQSNPLTDLGAFARNALPPSTLWLVSANGGEPKQLTNIGNPNGGHGSPAWSPDGKRIAFEANTFTSSSIWTVSQTGDDTKRVSPETTQGYAPVYAPDGNSIFYHSDDVFQIRINSNTGDIIGEPIQIAGIVARPSVIRRISFSADGKKMAFNVLRRTESISSVTLKANSAEANGAPIELISNATGRNNFPAFSPDGKRIAFSSCSTGGAGCDVWLANADGSNQTQLTTAESNELLPSWFLNGEQIAYISDRTGYKTYWAIDLNTKRERMLFDLKQTFDYGRLSPDGKQIVFNLTNDGIINIWTASLDDGEPKQLTFDKELAGFPTWSPDGKHIAFQTKRGDDTHVMIMPGDGGTATQWTFDKGQSWVFGWSPDEDKILFAGQRDGFWNAWWVSRSTKKQEQLTDYKKLNSFVRYPAWSPDGQQVVYEYSETTGNIWVADLKK